jgi:hypothetical protein
LTTGSAFLVSSSVGIAVSWITAQAIAAATIIVDFDFIFVSL